MSGKFVKGHPFSDIVPVEGAFVSSFLFSLPPIYVKIYLYLIYLCMHGEIKADSAASIASGTGVSEKDVFDALEQLGKRHLINYTAVPFTFEVLSAETAAGMCDPYAADSLSAYADYFAGIRSLFPKRSISNAEYDKARDWVEIYGLSVEAALQLISFCISEKDDAISFSYIDKVALSWANEGITTFQAAEEYLGIYQAKHHDAAALLRHLGIKRTPTVDEMKLYRKWSGEMGFDLAAIKAACSETTKTASPNFAYINRILEGLDRLNLHSAKEIKAYLAESDTERRLASAVLCTLGEYPRTVTKMHTDKLKEYKSAGFSDEILILVSRLTCESGAHTFVKYCAKLDSLREKHIFSADGIKDEFSKKPQKPKEKKSSMDNYSQRGVSFGDSLYDDPSNLEV